MAQTKQIDRERWSDFLRMFSNGNRGRLMAVEIADTADGEQPLADAAPLLAIDFDPAGKGDDLVITTGRDEIDFAHKISAPLEIWELQDDNGKVMALEVIGRGVSKTIIAFKS
jgi:hypothetical protein